ncbi:hypothetical protein TWF718_003506 [Orbilia javanica]|uniref:Uncharacterized protein n=1 Tax=Orbilia javanica TaxID=47235 RepID=A0AAN8MSX1_9PEZI
MSNLNFNNHRLGDPATMGNIYSSQPAPVRVVGLRCIEVKLPTDDNPSSSAEHELEDANIENKQLEISALPGTYTGKNHKLTSSTSYRPELSDADEPKELKKHFGGKREDLPFLAYAYPEVNHRKNQKALSPLAPVGARRAYQPRYPAILPSQLSTIQKLAHRSKPEHYSRLNAKIRKAYESRVAPRASRLTRNRREDIRSRERLFRQLRQHMAVPNSVAKCFKRLVKKLWQIHNPLMRQRLEQYSFVDMCDIFKFQHLKPQEYIFHLGWKGTPLDEPEIIQYLALIGKHAAGLAPWPKRRDGLSL